MLKRKCCAVNAPVINGVILRELYTLYMHEYVPSYWFCVFALYFTYITTVYGNGLVPSFNKINFRGFWHLWKNKTNTTNKPHRTGWTDQAVKPFV